MSKSWIQTYSGCAFDPLNPDPMTIMIEDIARALSRACRFTGHTVEHYSVAQHSVLASFLITDLPEERDLGGADAIRALARAALLHDASEAYLVDVPAPIKPHILGYAEIERKVMGAIGQKFCVPPEHFDHPLIKLVDRRMLATEKRDVMGPAPRPWGALLEPFNHIIRPQPAETARESFLLRFKELFS